MATGYDGRAIANFVLDFCNGRGRNVTHLDLQKIVYFCHVWSLIRLDTPLIRHKFEAWEYGPVLPYLYREFKSFERSPITARSREIDPMTGAKKTVAYSFDTATEALLNEVVDFYSRIRTGNLVELSHVEGGPWYKVWYHGGRANPGMKLNDDDIAEFYSKVSCPFSVQ
ncbi:Panacea domain-containing protein [Shinella zoogloeoides]|uniref:Panacea domain-containing protein n=1 Tax=Shinella zoogloeoides TaxID=352475 RepID=UPI003C76F841